MSFSLFSAAVDAPGRTALVVDGRGFTYAELAARVRRILPAAGARTAGAERVTLDGETDLATLETLYAFFELGRPVVLLHPRWSRREREDFLRALSPAPPLPGCLAVVPTSGSSGRPKGVVLSRRAFVAAAAASAENLGWREDDRWLLSLPIAHVGGLSILTRCLLARRTVVVHRGERFDAAEVAEVVERRRVTLLSLVPTTLRRLLELPWTPPRRLRAILVGGAAAPPELLASAVERGFPALATYGLTEACSQVATQRYGAARHGAAGCGPPLAGTEVRIRGGEIEVRGPQLMDGYLPAAPGDDPFTADGWLATGDLGRLDDDGNLHVIGRRDAVIVSGGENVAAAEVEGALEEHPAIAAACVFGVDDEEWGQAVAAALEAAQEPSDDELAEHLAARLARFKMPRRIAYLPQLPRLASGKVDRRGTAERAGPLLRGFGRRPGGAA